MEKRFIFRTIYSIITLSLILIFCSNEIAYSQKSASKVPVSVLICPQGLPPRGMTPQYGGILKMIYQNTPRNLSAVWEITSPHHGAMNRFAIEGLVGIDAKANPVPLLATSWDVDVPNKTVTFTLRKGVKFHDGTDFNAEAAKWCLEMYKKGPKPEMNVVKSIDVLDDYHLRLNLSKYDPLFVQSICTSGAGHMVSPTAYKKLGDDFIVHPVGTGPFKFVKFVPQVSLTYTKFDDYWQKGLPYLDGVEVKFVRDPVVALTSFQKGEAHVFNGVPTGDALALKKQGYTLDSNTVTILGIAWDSANPDSPFADIRVRRALMHAVDSEAAVRSAFDNMFGSTNQLALRGNQGWDTSIKGYPYDPDKARALLAEAGYGKSNPINTTLIYASDPQRADLYTLVQAYLSEVGINITLKPVPFPAYYKSHAKGWKGLHMYGFSYNGLEMQYAHCIERNLSTRAAIFKSLYKPEELTALLDVAEAEFDMDKREDYHRQMNKMAVDKYCLAFPMFGLDKFTAKSPKLIDFGFGNKTVGTYLPERAWLQK